MSSPAFATQIDSPVAHAIARALLEAGQELARKDFCAAVAWPVIPLPPSKLEICVTPKVTAAMLALVNGGQLAALIGSGVSSQEVLALATAWQRQLSQPQTPEADRS